MQQPIQGFIFTLIAAMAWGSLPIALQQVLKAMNAQTIIWYRFLVAAIFLFFILRSTRKLPHLHQFSHKYLILGVIGTLGLAGNFFFFNSSLNYIEPAIAQVLSQLSSFGMMLCGIWLFKEKMQFHQKIGLALLIIGLGLFFNDRFHLFGALNAGSIGIALSALGALVWVAYGICQKLMLRKFSSQQILFLMYIGCALLFTPFAQFEQIQQLSGATLACFIYCCLNTLIGYGAYAEALNRWDVSKVSVVITLLPLFTLLFSNLLHWFFPTNFAQPELNTISYLGAFIVVFGAITSAIGHKFIRGKK